MAAIIIPAVLPEMRFSPGSTLHFLALAPFRVCCMTLGKSLNILSTKMEVMTSMTLQGYCEKSHRMVIVDEFKLQNASSPNRL